MKNITKVSTGKLNELYDSSYVSVCRVLTEASSALAERTGFLALDLASVKDGTALWLVPEGRYLSARYEMHPEHVDFKDLALLEVDEEEARNERKKILGDMVVALERDDKPTADALFTQLLEAKKSKVWTVTQFRMARRKRPKSIKLSQAMKRAHKSHLHSYQLAQSKPGTARKKALTWRRHAAMGWFGPKKRVIKRSRLYASAYDALADALNGVKGFIPEDVATKVTAPQIENLIQDVTDLDALFAYRRYCVKTGKLSEVSVSTKPGVTFGQIMECGEKKKERSREGWDKMRSERKKLANEHRRVSFRERIESVRASIADGKDQEAELTIRELAIEKPELLYLTRDELTEQIVRVFEAKGVVGYASDISVRLYSELRTCNRARAVQIADAAESLFDENEDVSEDMNEAFVQITDRLYGALKEDKDKRDGAYKSLCDALISLVKTISDEVKDYADDDEEKIEADKLSAELGKHTEELKKCVEDGKPMDLEKLASIVYNIENALTDEEDEDEKPKEAEKEGGEKDAGEKDEKEDEEDEDVEESITSMVEDEGYVYAFEAADAELLQPGTADAGLIQIEDPIKGQPDGEGNRPKDKLDHPDQPVAPPPKKKGVYVVKLVAEKPVSGGAAADGSRPKDDLDPKQA